MLICGIKPFVIKIGDTIVEYKKQDTPNLPGYEEVKPMVFCGVFPVDSPDYEVLKESLEKLALNDSSFTYEPETSGALGLGFRCGFLGLLHMNIIQERLEREFELNLISTAPSVSYQVVMENGEVLDVDNPSDLPDSSSYTEIKEPIVELSIHVPNDFVGAIIKLCEQEERKAKRSGILQKIGCKLYTIFRSAKWYSIFMTNSKACLKGMPMDYEFRDFEASDLVKVDVLINGDKVDALSMICHRSTSYYKGRDLTQKLQKIINRQQFDVAIQVAIGAKILSRETVKALRKNVLAKCYGGDISRKRKLLEKQKEGKKRMKVVGNVELPRGFLGSPKG